MCIYRIRRKGQFSVRLIPNNKCGLPRPSEYTEQLFYNVNIDVNDLDNQGFIIDQFDIPKMFERYSDGLWEASCEQLAIGACIEIHKACNDRVIRIEVEVSPLPEAGAIVIWASGEHLPTRKPMPLPPPESYNVGDRISDLKAKRYGIVVQRPVGGRILIESANGIRYWTNVTDISKRPPVKRKRKAAKKSPARTIRR